MNESLLQGRFDDINASVLSIASCSTAMMFKHDRFVSVVTKSLGQTLRCH